MEQVFYRFKELFTERCNRIPILSIGEDSVRYDFFCAAMQVMNLQPWEIQLECSIHKDAYQKRKHPKSKRNENPQIDLMIQNGEEIFCVEFGLFRRNSNPAGTINKTGRTIKMLNDFIRLGLHSHFVKNDSFFVCVADSFILNHQMEKKQFDPFPAQNYLLDAAKVKSLLDEMKTAREHFDERFARKLKELGVTIDSEKIYDERITANKIEHETRILIWKVTEKLI
ncbi:MAG: hypothetical protein K1X63_12130 [Chitinophagales bacterium]|nr:hypothetical protein [Chitinophagales bacterium]